MAVPGTQQRLPTNSGAAAALQASWAPRSSRRPQGRASSGRWCCTSRRSTSWARSPASRFPLAAAAVVGGMSCARAA